MRARLIITLVLALLLTACGDDDGLTTTSTGGELTTTTAGQASTTTEGPTTTGGQAGESGWTRVAHDDAVFGVSDPSWMSAAIYGVTAGGPGLVAVGLDFPHLDFAAMGGVWTSPDGSAWSKSPWDPQAAMGTVEAVASGPLGLVAVGSEYNGSDNDAVVWSSPDGVAWSRVPDAGGVFGGPGWQGMHAVIAAGPGWVAVDHDDSGEDWNAAVWTSPDGSTWARVPHDETLFGGLNDQEMFGVASAGPGLVAVGVDDEAAGAWVSADGLAWQKVPSDRFSSSPEFAGHDKVMRAVTAGGPGFVAVGSIGLYSEATDEHDWDAAVWVSSDGITWVLVSEDAATFGGPGTQEMAAVTAGGSGFVAVGWDYASGEAEAAVWTSPDGTNWVRVLDPAVFGGAGDQEMRGVAVIGSRVVAVGRDGANAAVWVSPPLG